MEMFEWVLLSFFRLLITNQGFKRLFLLRITTLQGVAGLKVNGSHEWSIGKCQKVSDLRMSYLESCADPGGPKYLWDKTL